MNKMFRPVIKWSGSKRTQAYEILKYIPEYKTYYEPFLGGGSMLYVVEPKKAICGDICTPLIEIWNLIKNDPEKLSKSYKKNWELLQKDYRHFFKVRDSFNIKYDGESLFFLSRTCVNGLIRFNSKGEFNNSLHYSRKGINPETMDSIIYEWNKKISNVKFKSCDYKLLTKKASEGDFIYLDPPYYNTKGRYYTNKTIDFDEFIEYLRDLNRKNIKFALSFDGIRGNKEYENIIPKDVYKRHVFLKSGKSTFRKIMDKENEDVFESLYLNY